MAFEDRIDERLGRPVIRGSWIPVELILRKLAAGLTEADILDEHPRLTLDDVQAAREYSAVLEVRKRIRELGRRIGDMLDTHELWRSTRGREGAKADLRGADLRRLELPGVYLVDVDLEGADLTEAVLSGSRIESSLKGANLSNAHLEGVVFCGANLEGAALVEAHLAGATISGSSLRGADLHGAQLSGAALSSSDFSEANLVGAELQGAFHGESRGYLFFKLMSDELRGLAFDCANLSGADLRGARLSPLVVDQYGSELREPVSFREANLENADLGDGNFDEVDFEGAILDGVRRSSKRSGIRAKFAEVLAEHQRWIDSNGREGRRAELEGADLRGMRLGAAANLRRADLRRAHLEGANLAGADLSGAQANGAHFEGAILEDLVADQHELNCFEGASFHGAVLSGARLQSPDLTGAILLGAALPSARLENAELTGADLRGVDLTGAISAGASLRYARLGGARLTAADLGVASLKRADCERASFVETRLIRADLSQANLFSARLYSALLEGALLKGTDLRHARLDLANVWLADFEGAKLEASHILRPALVENASLRAAFAGSQPRAYLRLVFEEEDAAARVISALERIHRNVGMGSLRTVSATSGPEPPHEATVTGQFAVLGEIERTLSMDVTMSPEVRARLEAIASSEDVPLHALYKAARLFQAPGVPIAGAPVLVERDQIEETDFLPLGLVEDPVLASVARDLSVLETAQTAGLLRELEPVKTGL